MDNFIIDVIFILIAALPVKFWNETGQVCPKSTCLNRCSNSSAGDGNLNRPCDCYPGCKIWGRCCLDYEAVCEEKTANWSLVQIKNATDIILKRQSIYFGNVFLKERTSYDHIDKIYHGRPPFENGSNIFLIENCYNMIRVCPDDYPTTHTFYDKCQSISDDLLSKIPVSTPVTVYSNIYCAICNGLDVHRGEYFPWNIEYLCDNNTETIQPNVLPNANTTEQFKCQYVYAPPQSGPALDDFKCAKFIEKCNSSFERTTEIYRACDRYMAETLAGRVRYKNYHCAMCNERRKGSYTKCIGFHYDKKPFVKFTDGFKIKLPDFSKLITLFISQPQTDENSQNLCNEGEIKFEELCQLDDRSTQFSQISPGNKALFYIYLRTDNYANATTAYTKSQVMKRFLSLTMIDSIDENCEQLSLISESSLLKNSSLNTLQLCLIMRANANMSLQNIGIRKISEILELLIKTLCRAEFCTHPIIYKVLNDLEIGFNDRCQIGSAVVYDTPGDIDSLLTDETINLNANIQTSQIAPVPFIYDGVVIYTNFNDTYVKRNMSVTICEHVLNNCSKEFISETGFKRFNNDTVFIHKYRLFVTNDHFEYYNKGIVICSTILKYMKSEGYFRNLTKGILSLICITISLLSLACTFSVYCMLPTLRTIGGKSLMNLVAALFLGQLVFELSALPVGHKVPCLIVAVTQHYFFLVTFTWMIVLGYDLCSTFTSLPASTLVGRSGRLYIRYVVIAWALPLLVILPSLFLHFYSEGDYGYGEHYFCWLKNTRSIIFFFGIPLVVSILVNIGLFTRTAVAIYSAAKESNLVRKNNSLELTVIMKMASLMGFTWLFSILSGLIAMDVFDYLFIAFNGLQGFYLFLAFVTKKSTLNSFKIRFGLGVDSPSGTRSTN